jgi:predicted metal-dependent phosphoesterase TrpH
MTPFADLHCHTTCSDGSASPEKILDLAVKKGFKAVSITDHDTVEAYSQLLPMAQERGLEVMTGVEFSAHHQGVSVHILGYNFDLKEKPIHDLVERHKKRRTERNLEIVELLKQKKMPIDEAAFFNLPGVVGRPHIALAMIARGYVKTVKEAFLKYLGEGCSCYTPGTPFSVEETLEAIHGSKGKAVLAHPHLLRNEKILVSLMQLPFDGMECYYANFPLKRNKRWLDLAERKGWLITGGSDYHGTYKPTLHYGASYVDEPTFRKLQA